MEISKMYKSLKQGLDEAIEDAIGKKTLRAKEVKLPKPPKGVSSKRGQGLKDA